jgi:hypothetical protein
MNSTSRRGFLKSLGAALATGFVADPVTKLLVPERKIWAVGAQLSSERDRSKPANFSQLYQGLRPRPGYAVIALTMNGPEMRVGALLADRHVPIHWTEPKWPSRS